MKIRVFTGCALALGIASSIAQADTYAFTVEQANQGLQKGGAPVIAPRSNPGNTLGAPEGVSAGQFYSLGFGGSIVLGFGGDFGTHVTVWEATQGNIANHPESASVLVGWGASAATATFQLVGSLTNLESPKTFNLAATNAITGRTTYSYVKIVDTSDINSPLLPSTADGFDVDAVSVGPVPAPGSLALLAAAGIAGSRRRRR